MFNPIFKKNVQEREHPGRCAFAEPELLSHIKPKRVIQTEKNDHTNPNNSHLYIVRFKINMMFEMKIVCCGKYPNAYTVYHHQQIRDFYSFKFIENGMFSVLM